MKAGWYLCGGTIVRPDGVEDAGHLWTDDGHIASTDGPPDDPANFRCLDVREFYVLPGLIDLHTDTLEQEICPRRQADFPLALALQERDAKMLACGITTVFHSLHFGYVESGWGKRSNYSREEIFTAIKELSSSTCLARTKAHVRFETAGGDASAEVLAMIEKGHVDLLSFMDHTPGQGQYRAERFILDRIEQGKTREEAEALLKMAQERPKVPLERLAEVSGEALKRGIQIASHDDCSPEKVTQMHRLGVTISEFPVNLESAERALELGMIRLGGATNYLRGGSLSGNLNVRAALERGHIDGFCSDYYPPAMLQAVFKLWREDGWSLERATALATSVPARALANHETTGTLQPGSPADFIVVDNRGHYPRVVATFVAGRCVHQLTDISDRIARYA